MGYQLVSAFVNESPTRQVEPQTSVKEVNTEQVIPYSEPSASSMIAPEDQQKNAEKFPSEEGDSYGFFTGSHRKFHQGNHGT